MESRLSLELQLIIAKYGDSFQNFPMPRSGFSNLAEEAEGLARADRDGRNEVSHRCGEAAPNARSASPPVPKLGAVAPTAGAKWVTVVK